MPVKAFAAKGAGESLVPFEYELKPLGPFDLEISITHCGICHSDLHLINNDWGISQYPLVPGHEIVGTVSQVGPAVNRFGPGDRVGVGWQCGACLECDQCASGHDNLCPESRATCAGNYGGFADRIRVDSRYAFHIPAGLGSETVGPLMCGGITVYSPLRQFAVRPDMRVGVIGIGGLGHLALRFADAYGCDVTAFSSTAAKEAEARELGADHFVASNDEKQLQAVAGSFDFILSTVNADLDWPKYVDALKPRGNLCFVGATPGPITVHPFSLIMGNKSLSGSPIGGRATIREMLEFAARHGIEARTEVVPMSQVNQALARLRANQARYRMVLKN